MPKQFSIDYQPEKRKGRGPGWRTLIIRELEKRGESEETFISYAIGRAIDKDDKQSGLLLKELITRLAPIHKASAEPVKFDYPEDGTDTEKIDAIIKATSDGEIPPDLAKTIVDMIATRLDVLDRTELIKRLEKIEQALSAANGKAPD